MSIIDKNVPHIDNNFIVIPKSHYSALYYKTSFKVKIQKRNYSGSYYEDEPLYAEDKNNLYIPRGLINYVKLELLSNEELKLTREIDNIKDIKIYTKMSDKVILRSDQVYMINQMITHKRGIIQAGTGSGKTEVMSGFMKTLESNLGYYPPTLLLEPTTILVESTTNRFKRYNIPVTEYDTIRESGEFIENGVVIAHPKSIYNDLESGKMDLSKVKILLSDECQHLSASTWNTLFYNMNKVEFSIGMSAKAVIGNYLDISRYDSKSATIIGASGDVLADIDSSFYIEHGILSTPKLLRIAHNAVEKLPPKKGFNSRPNWHDIVKYRICSYNRNSKIVDLISDISKMNYKSLLLSNTKAHVKDLARMLEERGCKTLISFGGKEFLLYRDNEFISDTDDDPMKKFETGEYKILLGTSHLYEGIDVPNLDVVALVNVGKSSRRVIQAVGRTLRITKTGKYAYIVDFTDTGDGILRNHSRLREGTYKTDIGLGDSSIYEGSVDHLVGVFKSLENLKGN